MRNYTLIGPSFRANARNTTQSISIIPDLACTAHKYVRIKKTAWDTIKITRLVCNTPRADAINGHAVIIEVYELIIIPYACICVYVVIFFIDGILYAYGSRNVSSSSRNRRRRRPPSESRSLAQQRRSR